MALLGQQHGGLLLGGAMDALVRDLVQPLADMGIGGGGIEQQAGTVERGRQRRHEAALEVAVEALDLALGAGAVGTADAGPEVEGRGQVQQRRMPAVLAFAVGVALQDDGAGVVEEQVLRHAAEEDEGLADAGEPGLAVLALAKAHIGGAAVAEGGDKGLEGEAAAADGGEVDLQLAAGRRLEADDRVVRARLEGLQVGLELADAAVVAALLQLAQQHRGRNPVRMGSLDPLLEVALERVELGRARGAFRVLGNAGRLAQIAPDGVTGHAELTGNGLDAQSLAGQYVDLH